MSEILLSPSAPGPSPPEHWVSVDDVAAHLGVRKESIYRWIDARGLPARRIGKLWKMKLSQVDAWVETRGSAEDSSRSTPPSTDAPRPLERETEKRLVLVVDDEALARDTVADYLEDQGFGVLLASDGEEALAILRRASPAPCLIILDLGMPNLDGWQLREAQLRDPVLAAIPAIVITAVQNAEMPGVTVLRKPLRLPQLERAMREHLVAP